MLCPNNGIMRTIAGIQWSKPLLYEVDGPQTVISIPLKGPNHGINAFPVAKLTLRGGHGLTFGTHHRHMYTATYRTICYGWRVGLVYAIDIVNATAAPDQ